MSRFEEVTIYVNEKKRLVEKQQEMMQISQQIKGVSLIKPTRSFVQSGPFVKISENEKGRDVHLFLFNDLLVETSKPKKTVFTFKFQYPLSLIQIKDHPDTTKCKNLFELRISENGKIKSCVVYSASTREECVKWMEAISNCSLQNKEQNSSRHQSLLSAQSTPSTPSTPHSSTPSTPCSSTPSTPRSSCSSPFKDFSSSTSSLLNDQENPLLKADEDDDDDDVYDESEDDE